MAEQQDISENIIKPSTTNVYCNIIDWVSENVGDDDDKKYVIRFFGRTNTGLSLTVTVNNFFPYFFIKIPRSWSMVQVKKLINGMKFMSKDHGKYIYDYQPMEWKDFYGFRAEQKFNFLMIRFQCSDTMKFYHNRSKNGILEVRIDGRNEKFNLYESNFDPMLRFMHIQEIKSCGWIKLPKGLYRAERDTPTFTDYHLRINYENIVSQQNFTSEDPKLGLGKFKICSFDLECYSHDEEFPQAERKEDPIIQIGMVFQTIGEIDPKKYILTLKKCNEIDNTEVLSFDKEGDLLMEFQRIIQEEDPDILTGYNIYGFDEKYIYGRAKLLRLNDNGFGFLSRMRSRTEFKENVKLSSAALGDNQMHYYNTVGRVQIDLMKLIQKDYKLNSYKLDAVAEHFMREIIKKVEIIGDITRIYIKKPGEYKVGNFIKIAEEDDIISDKLKIINLTNEYLDIRGNLTYILDNETITKKMNQHIYFFAGIVKDDISARQMFKFYETGDPKGITTIAQYCIQDCILPIKLMLKLNKIPENMEMASISSVPMQWIFLRGQGIKSFSLVVKKCRKKGFLIKVLPRIEKSDDDDDKVGYEGAIVLTPEPKFHRVPISVNDYSSLYPSSMIAENISHEMIVEDSQYDNLPDYTYNVIKFDQKLPDGTTEEMVCKYAKKTGEFGVIPEILNDLLTERKAVRKMAESETDVFMKAVYEGRQLALKLTANSLYGQIGAGTSPVCYVKLAASTTAVGRGQIMIAKNFVEQDFKNTLQYIYENHEDKETLHEYFMTKLKNKAGKTLADDEKEVTKVIKIVKEVFDKYDINPKVVYGDTDSIFNDFVIMKKGTNEVIHTKEALQPAIELGILVSKFVQARLRFPHELSYEKTFFPFAIFSKKRYVGNKYTEDDQEFTQTSMGIVLKRRDNAQIVKRVIGGMVDIMMNEIDCDKTIIFTKKSIRDIFKGKYPIKDFVTSKTIKDINKYKTTVKKDTKGNAVLDIDGNEQNIINIAHVMLAQKMIKEKRANAPQMNDRVPFAYIEVPKLRGQKILQGEKIEHPDYIVQNNLKLDYMFYITNQIMTPAIQFLELVTAKPEDATILFNDLIKEEECKRAGKPYMKTVGLDRWLS
jgi:DNA polymerase elongation subunit (family B)